MHRASRVGHIMTIIRGLKNLTRVQYGGREEHSSGTLAARGSSKRPRLSASRDHGSKPDKGKSSVNIVYEDLVRIPLKNWIRIFWLCHNNADPVPELLGKVILVISPTQARGIAIRW